MQSDKKKGIRTNEIVWQFVNDMYYLENLRGSMEKSIILKMIIYQGYNSIHLAMQLTTVQK